MIDFGTQKQHSVGSDVDNLNLALPPDSSGSQCDLTPSSHLVLPCRDYSNLRVTSAVGAENRFRIEAHAGGALSRHGSVPGRSSAKCFTYKRK